MLILIHASDWEQRGSALVLASRHSPDQHPLHHDGRRKQARAIYRITRSKGQQQPKYGGLGRRAQEERLPIGHVAQQVLRNHTKGLFQAMIEFPGLTNVGYSVVMQQCPAATYSRNCPSNIREPGHIAQQVLKGRPYLSQGIR